MTLTHEAPATSADSTVSLTMAAAITLALADAMEADRRASSSSARTSGHSAACSA